MSYKNYRNANSKFVGSINQGIKVEAVLAKLGQKLTSSSQYIAICRNTAAPPGSALRVLDYHFVVNAANGTTNLKSRFMEAKTVAAYGLERISSHPVPASQLPSKTLVAAIKNETMRPAPSASLENIGVAETLAIMNKLVEAAKYDSNVRQLVKLIADTL